MARRPMPPVDIASTARSAARFGSRPVSWEEAYGSMMVQMLSIAVPLSPARTKKGHLPRCGLRVLFWPLSSSEGMAINSADSRPGAMAPVRPDRWV